MTGVPHAIASIITSPNGSGQSIGNSSADAPPSSSFFSASPISPTKSVLGPTSMGLIESRKYVASAASTLAAIFRRRPARRAMLIARSGRFSGAIRPTKVA